MDHFSIWTLKVRVLSLSVFCRFQHPFPVCVRNIYNTYFVPQFIVFGSILSW